VINILLIPASNKKQLIILGILGIFLLGVVIYSNVLHAPFVYDDYSSIIKNESIRSIPESLKNISSNRYLPLVSFALNYAVSGLKPFGYHLINNFIHIINAFLVYYLVILTLKTPFFRSRGDAIYASQYFIAFSSAFIFVVHPIQTQAVTYVVQRSTLMATMFYLLSLVMYIKARLESQRKVEVRTKKNNDSVLASASALALTFYLISFVSAVFAMKTKEITFTLPIIITLYEFSFIKTNENRLKRFLYLLPILLTILIIPLSMLNMKGLQENIALDIDTQSRETINISRTDYLITQSRVCMTYLRLLIFPVNQNFDYDYPVYHSFLNPEVFLSIFFLLVIFCIGIYLFHRSRFQPLESQPSTSHSRLTPCASRLTLHGLRLIAFGLFWFFITLSVESSIIPIRDVINEHRVYLPSIGFFITSALLVEYLLPHTAVKIALIIAIVVLLSIGTYTRNIIWKDPQTLWEDVIAKAPNNSRAYNNLGVVFKERKEFDKAIEQFEKSLRANRNYTAVYYNLGDVQYRLGNYEEAVAYFKRALTGKFNPQLHLDILNKLGRTYSAMGQTDKAIETFQEAVRLFPASVILLNNLGVQYIRHDQIDSAIALYENAIKIEEKSYLYSNLASAYAKKGDEEKSRLMYQRALELGNNNE
jgi:Tfp pilus assembly protein PilF